MKKEEGFSIRALTIWAQGTDGVAWPFGKSCKLHGLFLFFSHQRKRTATQ
jgi:hypothetical protein